MGFFCLFGLNCPDDCLGSKTIQPIPKSLTPPSSVSGVQLGNGRNSENLTWKKLWRSRIQVWTNVEFPLCHSDANTLFAFQYHAQCCEYLAGSFEYPHCIGVWFVFMKHRSLQVQLVLKFQASKLEHDSLPLTTSPCWPRTEFRATGHRVQGLGFRSGAQLQGSRKSIFRNLQFRTIALTSTPEFLKFTNLHAPAPYLKRHLR